MAKQITLNYKGVDYTLEFNRKIVHQMEGSGFVIDTDKPETLITELFRGAFRMHHKRTPPETIDEIWTAQRNKSELLTALVSMYTEPISALMDEDDAGENDTPTWKLL